MARIQKYLARNAARFLGSFTVCALLSVSASCWADNNAPSIEAQTQAQADRNRAMLMRSGGILNESFDYHHPQPMRSAIELGGIPQANGWYEYGFPMQSYRWGWFGAERHFPEVTWHQGYYGESVRASTRSAY